MARKETDNNTVKRINETERKQKAFIRDFERFIERSLDDILTGLEGEDITAIEAAKALGDLHEQLLEMGLEDALARIETIYADEFQAVRAEMEEIAPGVLFSEIDADAARALMELNVDAIEDRVRVTGSNLRTEVMRDVVGGQKVDRKALRETYGTKLGHNIETEISTGISAYHQSLINKKSDELGLELFVYLGPLDNVTRPICRHILEKGAIFTDEERKQFNGVKGATLPVETYGGGYNCRHQWSPIRPEDAADLYDYNG